MLPTPMKPTFMWCLPRFVAGLPGCSGSVAEVTPDVRGQPHRH
jgi:hypothetical protein